MAGGQPTEKRQAALHMVLAPLRGWSLSENRAQPREDTALKLDNWVCTTRSVRIRSGALKYATLGDAVTALFRYKTGSTEKFFGATASSIYDLTTVADPAAVPTAAVTGQTSGDYSTEQFGTTSGNYLYICNGTDSPRLYDGSTFTAITGASSPAITGVTTSNLSFVWAYASRLFFVEKNTLKAWYLPVDSIGGAATSFSLAGIFTRGGSLLCGATWSVDAGDGMDDKCVFISTEGEVAIYSGTDPSSASAWSKDGVYQIGAPLGFNAISKAGGDLLIATKLGLIPLSQAISRDTAALSLAAVSMPIEPYWQEMVQDRVSKNWQIIKHEENGYMVVSQPEGGPSEGSCLVVNLHTAAWSRFTGWDTQCVGRFLNDGYFGSANAKVYRMEVGGYDDTMPYTAIYLGQHSNLGIPGAVKTVVQARAYFEASTPILPYISAQADYATTTGQAPNAPAVTALDGWDVSAWDVGLWDAASTGETSLVPLWYAVGVSGAVIAPEVQLSSGSSAASDVEFASLELAVMPGAYAG